MSVYITDQEIEDLPDDPELAFVRYEEILRARYEKAYWNLGENEPALAIKSQYFAKVLSAAKHYQITSLSTWTRPDPSELPNAFDAFVVDVDYATSELRLRSIERQKRNSVMLDENSRVKLQHLLVELRETVKNLDVSIAKKERLYSRINELQDEFDKERTRFEAFGALVIELCGNVGEAAEKLKPAVELVERIGAAIGIAKSDQKQTPQLPPKQEQKRLEPPRKRKSTGGGFDNDVDDEIPF